MKIILAAMNAKYIHTNLGIYSLRAYAYAYLAAHGDGAETDLQIELAEYTINQTKQEILADLYRRSPDIVACSCYLWNRSMWLAVIEDFHKILPEVPIWFGGPEVSFDAKTFLEENPFISGVMVGEGEQTFAELVIKRWEQLPSIAGIVYRNTYGEICKTAVRPLLSMDDLVFPYRDLTDLEHRIIYYETSRGCPFGCSYCLSSVDKKVRLRSMTLVEKELQFFLDHNVPQVKFVDRTFNCNPAHTMAIWKYIYEHDNGITNFHFEMSAELLRDEEIAYVRQFRPGLVQFEIGVQSANQDTLGAIHRKSDLAVLKNKVDRIHEARNIHQHLDLIAGLPYENYESFRESFRVVYEMRPDQLQLGFLKVLRGSPLAAEKETYGIVYTQSAPYEVLRTNWLTFDDILRLKQVEDMVERYYNSMQFVSTLPYLVSFYANPFDFYQALGVFYQEKGYFGFHQSRMQNYEILLEYAETVMRGQCTQKGAVVDLQLVKELMTLDLYLRENMKTRPQFAPKEQTPQQKKFSRAFYIEENRMPYFAGYENYDMKQIARMTHIEYFTYDVLAEQPTAAEGCCAVYFDYQRRDALSHQAFVQKISEND